MSSINFMGSYSGIDMAAIDQLIQAESGRKVQYNNKKTDLTAEKNAWKDVNTRLDSLFKKFEEMKKTETFHSRTTTNSNEDVATVSANSSAIAGTYRLQVEQLATSSQLTSGKIGSQNSDFTIETDLALSGDLELEDADGVKLTVTIETGDSLKDIVTKINEQAKENESGLQATIIDNRLVVVDSNMGERDITLTGSEGILEGLSIPAFGTAEWNANFHSGQPAKFELNGIAITRNTNTISDAVEGLTLTLTAKSPTDAPSIITVEADQDKVVDAVQEFVDQYNSVMTFIGEQLDVGDPSAEGNTTGALVGDSALMRLQSQMRSMLSTNSRDADAPIRGLSELGIELDRDGQATFDTEVLKEKLSEDASAVESFFFRKETLTSSEGEETKSAGIAESMTKLINDYIADKTGIISNRSDSIDNRIKDIDKQIETFNQRLEKKRERYIKQFTALDTAMMQAESQLGFLMSQISASSNNANQ